MYDIVVKLIVWLSRRFIFPRLLADSYGSPKAIVAVVHGAGAVVIWSDPCKVGATPREAARITESLYLAAMRHFDH